MSLLSTMIFSGGCGGKTTQNESPENKEKTTLIFEIDEGLGVSELTTIYGSDRAALDRALYNISDGLSPLKSKKEWYRREQGDPKGDPNVRPILKDLDADQDTCGNQEIKQPFCVLTPENAPPFSAHTLIFAHFSTLSATLSDTSG